MSADAARTSACATSFAMILHSRILTGS